MDTNTFLTFSSFIGILGGLSYYYNTNKEEIEEVPSLPLPLPNNEIMTKNENSNSKNMELEEYVWKDEEENNKLKKKRTKKNYKKK
jgi:hypothetical protein